MRRGRGRELGRRLYAELVRGRTSVRLVAADAGTSPDGPPRFVLSPYRSGTTLLRYCLDSHPHLVCPPETDYLAHCADLLDDPASMAGLADLGWAAEDVRRRLAAFGRSFLDAHAAAAEKPQWVDKSPRYAEEPARLQRLFPDARTVVLHRHPLDQVHSFTRGGAFAHPALGLPAQAASLDRADRRRVVRAASSYWADVTRKLSDHADVASSSCLTIRYEELCARPAEVLRAVLTHFGLPWSAEVLDYHKHRHGLGREAGRVAGTSGFRRSTGGWRSWPEEWRNDVWDVVARPAGRLGYERSGEARPADRPST